MPSFQQLMEHEEHRWSYMTPDQLLRRLRRITQPQKLRCFAVMASRQGSSLLEREVQERASTLGVDLSRELPRAFPSSWDYSERAVAGRLRQAQGRTARGGPVSTAGLLSEALFRSSTTSPSVPTTSQRSTRSGPVTISGRPTTFSVDEITGPLFIPIPKSKKKKPKKKAVRHIRFSKGDV